MTNQRRSLLKAGAGSLAMAGLGLPAAHAEGQDFSWSRAGAELLVGQYFWLNHPEHRALQIKLEAVQAPAAPTPGMQHFTLLFSAAAAPAIKSGTYDIEQEVTGHSQLFLQPTGARQGTRVTLRAEFNLLA